jgi:integrase
MTLNCPLPLKHLAIVLKKEGLQIMRYTYKKERRDPQIQSYETQAGKRWRVKFSMTAHGRKHNVEKNGFISFDAARAGKTQAINDIQNNISHDNVTVREYFEMYSEEKLANGSWRYTTYKGTTTAFKKHVYPDWGDIRMADVQRLDWQRWLTKKATKESYAKKTLQSLNGLVSSAFNDAVLNDIIQKSPIQKIKVSGKPSRDTSLTRSEFQTIFNFIKSSSLLSTQDRTMALLTTLGLRHEEIDGLKLKYVKDNMIGVFEVLNQHNDLTPPKTASSKRWVPLTPLVEKYLSMTIDETREVYAKHNIIMSRDSFVFVNSLARPLRYSHLTYVFQTISKETGIHVWPHKMRHAFSTIAFGIAGLNPRDIANILGHSQIDMSLYYNNGTDEGKTSAMAKISQAF